MMGSFHHGTAVLGTRHGKEAVIVPTLRAELGLEVELLSTLDTDRFGTFTREVPRLSSARETVRAPQTRMRRTGAAGGEGRSPKRLCASARDGA